MEKTKAISSADPAVGSRSRNRLSPPRGSGGEGDGGLQKQTLSVPVGRRKRGSSGQIFWAAARAAAPGVWLPILGQIFGGCCSNVYTLEALIKDAPNSGHLITFAQFLVVTADGLLHHLYVPAATLPSPRARDYLPRLRPRVIPAYRWLLLVVVFFIMSTANNSALSYDISMPFHILFRSGGLIVSIILGRLMLGKRYSASKILAVGFITVGVLLATFSVSNAKTEKNAKDQGRAGNAATGLLLLSLAIFLSGWLGILQEVTYQKYGKQWREGLFYTHAYALPFFLVFRRDIFEQAAIVANSTPVLLSDFLAPIFPAAVSSAISRLEVRLPKLAVLLVLNVFTQYICISGVHRLTSVTTALTVNLVLNVRKFVSLALSVWYFGNPFPILMKTGSVLVFVGSLIYSLAGSQTTSSQVKRPAYPSFEVPSSPMDLSEKRDKRR